MHIFLYLWSFPYLRWLLFFALLPSIFLWGLQGKYLILYKKTILIIFLLSFFSGIATEIIAVDILHLWYYSPLFHHGFFFLGLPLEEYLFLIFFPQMLTCVLLLVRKGMQ